MSGIAPLVNAAGRHAGSGGGRGAVPRPALPALSRQAPPRGEHGASPFSPRTRPSWCAARARSPRSVQRGTWRRAEGDALGVVRGMLAGRADRAGAGTAAVPGRRAGYIGYDYGAVLERLPAPRYDDLAHSRRRARPLRLGDRLGPPARQRRGSSRPGCRQSGPERDAPGARSGWRWCAGGCAAARPAPRNRGARRGDPRHSAGPAAPVLPRHLRSDGAEAIGLRSTFTHRGYLDAVARVREYIVAGDIFQANLSQRFQAPLGEPPFELYRRLRRRNPGAVRRLSRLRRA